MYRKKHKKLNKKKVIYGSLLVVLFIAGFILNVVTTNRNLSVFEKAIKDSVISIENVIRYPIHKVFSKIEKQKQEKNLKEEYQNLLKENESLKQLESTNQELLYQIEQLKSALELDKILAEYSHINATVIGRNLDYWSDTILLDKGEYSGVTVGMPVVVKEGLLGKVIQTSTFTSTVRLLSASTIDKISVKVLVDDDYVYGILNRNNASYIIEGIPQNIDIQIGALVTTTGMGDIFPSGIVVGQVVNITTDTFDLEKVLEIKPNVDFNSIHYVSILKRNAS